MLTASREREGNILAIPTNVKEFDGAYDASSDYYHLHHAYLRGACYTSDIESAEEAANILSEIYWRGLLRVVTEDEKLGAIAAAYDFLTEEVLRVSAA